MRTKVTIFVLTAIFSVFAFSVQSDEPNRTNDRPTLLTSPIGQELLDTLELAFTKRLDEYRAGRSGPEHAIRLNEKFYDEQISAAAPSSRRLVAENYVERATLIEEIAKRSLENGTGLSPQLLEAKAARLSATLACDCEKRSQRIVQVTVQHPGASSSEVADALASTIEIRLRELPHLDSITSISSAERLEVFIAISHDGQPQKMLRRIAAELHSGEIVLPYGADTPTVELLPRAATVPAESPTEIDGIVVAPKREALAKYGISVRNLVLALRSQADTNVSAVSRMEKLQAIRVTGPDGNDVPASELAQFRVEKQPSHIVTRWPSE